MKLYIRPVALATAIAVVAAVAISSAQAPVLAPEQIEAFLLTAKIVDSRRIGRGATNPWRLTLSDGTLTHDASFQSIDQRRDSVRLGDRTELKFADSYHFNIAAYRLARLLGLDYMVPVSVEREWQGKRGALEWWVDDAFDEKARLTEKRTPPDLEDWRLQTYRMYVFWQLVHDTDRNQTNILYTPDWKLWMRDFSRAFRPWSDIPDPKMLYRCDRQLFEKLQALDADQVRDAVGNHLTTSQLGGLMGRRDKIVEFFRKLIAEKGEAAVLY